MKKKNIIYNTDAREILKVIQDPIVDLIITSPPYADLKNYGTDKQIGFGQNYETEYLPSLKNVFFQCYAVSKNTGSMWVIVDTFKKNGSIKLLPFDIVKICAESGWVLRDIIIWGKGKTLPWSRKGQLRNQFEYILFFTKSNEYKYYVDRIKDTIDLKEWWVKYPERYSRKGKNPGNIWEIQIPVQGSWSTKNFRHFCPFPTELVEKIVSLSSDVYDLVLDPFAGSGVVLAQAHCMKRKYIGFEINPKYVELFKKDVLPTLSEETKNKVQIKSIARQRKELEENITALRALKYPKIILKSLKEHDDKLSREVVAAYVEMINKPVIKLNKFAYIKLIVIVKSANHLVEIEEKLKAISTKPPLSKYGLESEIKIVQESNFITNIQSHIKTKQVYLYLKGRTHYYDKKIQRTEIKYLFDDQKADGFNALKYVPILSSVNMRQKIIKTWKQSIFPKKESEA